MSLFAPKSGVALTWQEDGTCRGLRLEWQGTNWKVAATWSASGKPEDIPAQLATGWRQLDPERETSLICGSSEPDLMLAPFAMPPGLSPEDEKRALNLALPRLFTTSELVTTLVPGGILALKTKTWEHWLARSSELRPDLIAAPQQVLAAFPGSSLALDDFDYSSRPDGSLEINGSPAPKLPLKLGIECPDGFDAALALSLFLLHPAASNQRRRAFPVPSYLRPTRQHRQRLLHRLSYAIALFALAAAGLHYWQQNRAQKQLWASRLAEHQVFIRKVQVPPHEQAETAKLLEDFKDPKNTRTSQLSFILAEVCRQLPQGVVLESVNWSQQSGIGKLTLHLSNFGNNPPNAEEMLAPVSGLSGLTLNPGFNGGPWVLSLEVKP